MAVDPVAAATYFVQTIGCGAFPVWGSRSGKCLCGDPHDGTRKHGPDNVGKHPASDHGFKDATADLEQIRTFLHNPGTPNYGLNAPPGVMVIDVDGAEGLATWDQLQHTHGPLPVTLTTTTANGRHYFYRWPESAGSMPTGKLFGFVVRRHDDGYVIGPGSVHPSGVVYDTLRQPSGMPYPIVELPTAWAAAASKPPAVITIAGDRDPTSVPVGGRHDWLRNTARLFAGVIRDPDALRAAVLVENAKLPVPKSEAEVDRAIGAVLERFAPDPVEQDPETGEIQRIGQGEGIGLLSPRDDTDLFPEPPASAAFGGLLGECVEFISGGTDASAVALLAAMVAFCGALMPASAYFHGNQTSSPFLALVGHTGDGRKGTAMYRARDALGLAIGMQAVNRARFDGVASGEGLVKALSDRGALPTGVLFEEEYAGFLAASGRDGSTLDTRMRSAFDGNQLSNRKVGDTLTVPEPYWLSGLVSITPAELQERVPRGSFKSGSGNRWLWLPVRRRDVIVRSAEPVLPRDLSGRLVEAHRLSMSPGRKAIGAGVDDLLTEYDRFLRANSVGLEADMTRRYTVIALRIALVHAAVETEAEITRDHVTRAVALTEYARRGMEWVFGATLGNGASTLLLRQLQEEGSLSNGTISKYLIRDPQKRQEAVDELCRLGLARVEKVTTSGRKRTELVLEAREGGFRDFRALFTVPPKTDADASERVHARAEARERVQKGTPEHDTGCAEGARKVAEVVDRETGEIAAQKVAEVARETGEIADSTDATWLRPCRGYHAHQDHHRRTQDGWICLACDKEGTPT